MLRFVARRLVFCAVLIVFASSAALLLTRLAPGDLATTGLGQFARAREIEDVRARFSLDRPVAEQWADWMSAAARFDFGESFLYGRAVGPLVATAARNTAILATVALVLATIVGIGLGMVTGTGRPGIVPSVIRAGSIAAISLPPLLTSLGLMFLAARTGWFPVGSMDSGDTSGSWVRWIADVAFHLPVPALALALPVAAAFERLQSSALHEQMHQPFVTAASARGVDARRLVLRHAWPVSWRAVAGVYGLAAGSLLSGSFVVEFVTAWPGLGRLMYDALRARDIYLVAGCAAMGAALLSVGMLIGDVLLALSDPRVREAE
jgi:peptide/nickel transport system permease protein